MTTYHPVWDRLGLTGGELLTLRYITAAGEEKELQGKVKGFNGQGQVIVLEYWDHREHVKKLRGIKGDSVQRYLDAQARAEHAERMANAPKATPGQVDYAYDLIHDRLGQIRWANTTHGQGWTMPTRETLAAMSKREIGSLISEMREELGYED